MKQLTIPGTETGVLRVFAVSRPIPDMARASESRSKADLASELLGQDVPDSAIELFALSDLTGVGLSRYLIDGQGAAEAEVAPDRTRLDALDGYVLLLRPGAFAGRDVTLRATPDLTLIGTYREEAAQTSAPPIDSEAAQPYSGVAPLTPAKPPKGRPGNALVIVAIAVLLVIGLIWLLT